MATTGNRSAQQLLGIPYVAGRVSRIAPTKQVMSNAYGVGLKCVGSGENARISTGATKRSPTRSFVYDYFDSTRKMAGVRAPGAGPYVRNRTPMGTNTVTGLRVFNTTRFTAEEIRDLRKLGGDFNRNDPAGSTYRNEQLEQSIIEACNTREFAFTQMLKGELQLQKNGDAWDPVVSGGDITIDFQVPSTNKGQLDLGTGSDLITAGWQTSSTDISTQLLNIFSEAHRLSGFPPTEIWINSKTWAYLVNNEKLQAQGGSAFRVWDESTEKTASTGLGQPQIPQLYYTKILRGLGPQFRFHVYDGGLVIGNGAAHNSTDSADWVKFIPDDYAIFTPPLNMKGWFDWYDIREIAQEGYTADLKDVYGFHSWGRRDLIDEMPKYVHNVLDNFIGVLTVPKAVMYAQVANF